MIAALKLGACVEEFPSAMPFDSTRPILAVLCEEASADDNSATTIWQYALNNDPARVGPFVERIQDQIRAWAQPNDEDLHAIGVALDEALRNAVYHGNLGVSTDLRNQGDDVYFERIHERQHLAPYCYRQIYVVIRLQHDRIMFVVRDEGRGFDVPSVLERVDQLDCERTHGRGLVLIRALMDEVAFNDRGNQITLARRLAV